MIYLNKDATPINVLPGLTRRTLAQSNIHDDM